MFRRRTHLWQWLWDRGAAEDPALQLSIPDCELGAGEMPTPTPAPSLNCTEGPEEQSGSSRPSTGELPASAAPPGRPAPIPAVPGEGDPPGPGVTWSLPPPPGFPEPGSAPGASAPGASSPTAAAARTASSRADVPTGSPSTDFSRSGNCHVKHSRLRVPGPGYYRGRAPPAHAHKRQQGGAGEGRGGAEPGWGGAGAGRGRPPSLSDSLAARPPLFSFRLSCLVCFPPTGQRFQSCC